MLSFLPDKVLDSFNSSRGGRGWCGAVSQPVLLSLVASLVSREIGKCAHESVNHSVNDSKIYELMKNDKVWWIRIERESESLKRRQIGITIPKDSTHTSHHFFFIFFLEIIRKKRKLMKLQINENWWTNFWIFQFCRIQENLKIRKIYKR